MLSVIAFFIGVIIGGTALFFILLNWQGKLKKQKNDQQKSLVKLEEAREAVNRRRQELSHAMSQFKTEHEAFGRRVISYDELQNENKILKRDLHNIDINLHKLRLDSEKQGEKQDAIDERSMELGGRYLKENVKWIGSSITPNNYAASKKRLLAVIERCRSIGFEVTEQEEASLLADLKTEYEKAVRVALEREEQARIKAQIREEQQLEKEIERELKRLERERAAIRAALEKALAETKDEHSAEIEQLKARLAEAEEKAERTKARAEMTKSGHVYVISNIGSFGEDVYKIGMTRRLEPEIRVRELGDASVPFPFDVHMMISSDNAPKLENDLHRVLHDRRVNRVNPRKEFFKADFDAIREIVIENHGEVEYLADPEALQYRQSIEMSEEDAEYIEQVYDEVGGDDAGS